MSDEYLKGLNEPDEADEIDEAPDQILGGPRSGVMDNLAALPGRALGSMGEQLLGLASLPGMFLDVATQPVGETAGNLMGHFAEQSIPQTAADAAIPLSMPAGVAAPAIQGASRGVANIADAFMAGQDPTFGQMVGEMALRTGEGYLFPGVTKLTKAARGTPEPKINKAPLANRIQENIIFKSKDNKLDVGETLARQEIVTTGGELTDFFKKEGIIRGHRPEDSVYRYIQKEKELGDRTNAVLSKPVTARNETIGQVEVDYPEARTINTGDGFQVDFDIPEVNEVLEKIGEMPPDIASQVDIAVNGWKQALAGTRTIDDLQKLKRLFYVENNKLWRGTARETRPDAVERIEKAMGSYLKRTLNENVDRAGKTLGAEAQAQAKLFAPLNETWSKYLDGKQTFIDLGKSLTKPGFMNPSLRGAMLGFGIGAAADSAAVGASAVLGGGQRAMWAGANALDRVAPMFSGIDRAADMVGGATMGALSNPQVMGPVASLQGEFGFGSAEAQPLPPQPLPRTAEALRQNPGAVLPLLPPEMHSSFWKAMEGSKDDINNFMSRALQTVPGLVQSFEPSAVSQDEFGGRFQDPAVTFGLYQDVTSRMLKGELDPRKGYRDQLSVIQGKAPKGMQ